MYMWLFKMSNRYNSEYKNNVPALIRADMGKGL